MKQEAAEKLFSAQFPHLCHPSSAVIFSAKADHAVADKDQARIGNGHAMGIAAEILEDLLGTAPGRFGVDDPRFGVEVLKEQRPGGIFAQRGTLPGKGEPLLPAQPLQPRDVLPAEDLAQRLHGKQEAPSPRTLLRAIRSQAAARDHTVDMDMLGQRLPPRVEHGRDPEFHP